MANLLEIRKILQICEGKEKSLKNEQKKKAKF